MRKRPSFCYWEKSIYINPLLDNGRYLDCFLKVLWPHTNMKITIPLQQKQVSPLRRWFQSCYENILPPCPPVSIILLPTGTGSGSVHSPKKPVSTGKQMANSSAQVLESVSLGSNPSSVTYWLCNLGRYLNNSVPSPLHLRFRLTVPLKGFWWELN